MKLESLSVAEAFSRHVGQTSPFANGLQVAHADGCYIYDADGKQYLDFIAGIAVCNVGHCHPRVVEAVQKQASLYAHTMVYGEHIQSAQVELAVELARVAPNGLDCTYFLTTGAEANDAALKMAVKLTGRSKSLCAFNCAYHGDTVGALACFGDDWYRKSFASLLVPVTFLDFGDFADIEDIDTATAAVIMEPVQGEAGIRIPPNGFLEAVRERCTATGAVLIFDEVQTGFGRIGNWFAAGHYGVTPDVITIAKGMGAGMPLAGVLSDHDRLNRFAAHPPFSHISTFGGHPVSCAAGLAALRVFEEENLLENARSRGEQIQARLREIASRDERIHEVRGIGLMIGAQMADNKLARQMVTDCKDHGLILETNLLDERVIRFSPPLNVTLEQCEIAVNTFSSVLASA